MVGNRGTICCHRVDRRIWQGAEGGLYHGIGQTLSNVFYVIVSSSTSISKTMKWFYRDCGFRAWVSFPMIGKLFLCAMSAVVFVPRLTRAQETDTGSPVTRRSEEGRVWTE